MNEIEQSTLSQEEYERRGNQLYLLVGKQVQGYHKAKHMGSNTSVPVELAQDLIASILYTLDQVGGFQAVADLERGMERGQAILEEKLARAWQMLRLVDASAPDWQGECRWDTVRSVHGFLERYDLRHLAHRTPDIWYSFLLPVPDDILGIDCALKILQMLWLENQLIEAFPENPLTEFWTVFCQDDRGLSENPCERLLINGTGKLLIGRALSELCFDEEERELLLKKIQRLPPDEMRQTLEDMLDRLMGALGIRDPNAIEYAEAVIPNLLPRLEGARKHGDLAEIFL